MVLSLLWWGTGRSTASSRRLSLHRLDTVRILPESPESVTILAWNLAHGRGDVDSGWLANWGGGGREERARRLLHIAQTLREADADIVVLNEVDFDAGWSHGVNQAEFLARTADYPYRVEQRNYDVQLPFASYAFGNALLSRIPLLGVEWVDLPPHSGLEALLAGAKSACLVGLELETGTLAVIPVHLEARNRSTRHAALPVLDSVAKATGPPVVLAGDFNSFPSGWPGGKAGSEGTTALDSLLALGWTSLRARASPGRDELTFPTSEPESALDWILVEPPLHLTEARVLGHVPELSDHAPVLGVLSMKPPNEDGGKGIPATSTSGPTGN